MVPCTEFRIRFKFQEICVNYTYGLKRLQQQPLKYIQDVSEMRGNLWPETNKNSMWTWIRFCFRTNTDVESALCAK